MPKLIPIIGIEKHTELKTNSKMFCSCRNNPDREEPNTNICEVCLAHPGTLPTANKEAIIWTVKIARALGCGINAVSKFDRKHYFYPDLPKAYQISQYDEPIGTLGALNIQLVNVKNHRDSASVGIRRVHLEEDTAKLTHDRKGNTLVDFNRAGVPLVEIVSDPDIQSSSEAKIYCQEIQSILRYLGASDADMEKGHLRCEANISIQEEGSFVIRDGSVFPAGENKLNNKVELKNINSFRAIEKAIDFEIKRQTSLLETGETWGPETRGWNDNRGETFLQRTKESSADYRYFPEPDIPPFHPLEISGEFLTPELPSAKRQRLHEEYGFSFADAQILTADENWATYTEEVYGELVEWLKSLPESAKYTKNITDSKRRELAKITGGWLTTKLMGAMTERKKDIRALKIKPENFAELVALIFSGRINSTNAQKVLIEMLDSGTDTDPTHIMEEKGYGQISDKGHLKLIIETTIKNYPSQVAEFKAGKEPILQFLKGMVMKATEGSADPQIAEKLLRDLLK